MYKKRYEFRRNSMGTSFHENMKIARKRKKMSQKDVAEIIGVAKSSFSLYESGNREPNIETIRKIAAVLDVTPNELFGTEEEPSAIAAHFEGDDYTEEEIAKIEEYAAFIKTLRK